jgi:REP element-mobilizing transposase RayT
MRKPETITFWRGRLPHWEVEDGRYFVTVHVAGAIPLQGQRRLRAMSAEVAKFSHHNAPEWLKRQRMIFAEMERWLDRAERNAHFQQAEAAKIVMDAIEHRKQRGDWDMFEYVVMPTHVHLFFELGRPGLKTVMVDFKRWTGHELAKLLQSDGDRVWQREWFDHWSRSDGADDRIVRYIQQNPEKAGLVKIYTDWPYRSRSRLPGGT